LIGVTPFNVQSQPTSNGFAVAALVLGVSGFLLMVIPLFIGWVLGGIPDVLAVIFGVLGMVRARKVDGRGLVPALIGLSLAVVSLGSVSFGAGSSW